MLNTSNLQIIECVITADKDYLQSLLAIGYYALALKTDLLPLTTDLDFTATQTQIIPLEPELPCITQQGNTIATLSEAHRAGVPRFYSAIKGIGNFLPSEKLLTYFQAQHIPTGINLLAFESAYNEALALNS
ncbi:hypothetical protein RCZ04_15490 [Capnocytophaga sp. HP1101]